MSSYAKLKEMALKKAEEEQAALNRERERREREVAAKLAEREAREREQKDRERKILLQRMTRQKEEEAREKMQKERAVKLEQEKVADEENAARPSSVPSLRQGLSSSARTASVKASCSTQKVDLSHRLKAKPSNGNATRRKRKVEEDDFVGNRLDKIGGSKAELTSSFAGSSTPKRKATPMTREEKQAIKRAREFGSLPKLPPIARISSNSVSARFSPSVGAGDVERTNRPSARSQLAKDNGLVALGTKKRDHRSIDEIERDLRKVKEARGNGRREAPSQAELEREAALARRQKAMEEKRKSDLEARELASRRKLDGSGDDSKDDLFGSDDDGNEAEASKRRKMPPSKDKSQAATANGSHSGSASTSRFVTAPQSREVKPIAARAPGGINPADFLPGAPLRPEAMARLSQKARTKTELASASRVKSPESDSRSKPKRTVSESDSKSSPAPALTSFSAGPPRRETARERFIREQEEKKKLAAGRSDDGGRKAEGRSSRSDEYASEEDNYSDEYDSDGIDDDDDGAEGEGGQSYRDEIWKLFGKDRKKYASRVVDSDDDMEADAASVLQEELRSSKQAREEDLREELLEKQREREKLLRKQALKRGAGR
ncbi:uncharacterized protein UMAG_01030 [Mycosarcoma maydis]|uniref:SPT2 chromatin protein n=1 Tax=Mycosarcoma maydis TaxID=5270 RepID=A0A0D1E9Q6_MYCMD|nr:uncharacterized protein UMAG_01030 [Ustilago maydis 521]KIS71120.1 hypothetical protein UMAG_01030 [Ustilago maydis 521]|eukprot:XP_011387005.1 hypothetical protein UMAG_01030 [Ustilago maydis 521]